MSGDFIICDAHLTPLNAYGRSVPFGEGCRKPSLRLGPPGDHLRVPLAGSCDETRFTPSLEARRSLAP